MSSDDQFLLETDGIMIMNNRKVEDFAVVDDKLFSDC
jgi:hypothetical protein